MTRIAFAAALITFAATLAACGSSSGTGGAGGGYACPALAEEAPQLLYPIPGATGVPTAAADLIFASQIAGTTIAIVPASGSGPSVAAGPFEPAPSPLPSPLATTEPAGTALYASAYPALAAHTTYTLSFSAIAGSNGCTIPIGFSGSFTTE